MKTVIVRDRGQFTIPESVRQSLSWVRPMSAITITVVGPEEISLRPHKTSPDWSEIWKMMDKLHSLGGKKGVTSATDFLERDRASHV